MIEFLERGRSPDFTDSDVMIVEPTGYEDVILFDFYAEKYVRIFSMRRRGKVRRQQRGYSFGLSS